VESAFRTPLLDFFRRGDVPHDIRLLAAEGLLAPRAHEQMGMLMHLVNDADADVAAAAEATLRAIPRAALDQFLARSDVSTDMRQFFASRSGAEIAASGTGTAAYGDVTAEDSAGAVSPAGLPGDGEAPLVDKSPQSEVPAAPVDAQTTLQRIAAMTVAQRVALAMKGSREERAVLIRDSNKIVGLAVLSSPKMSETEVESIAKMASVSEELLRVIASTRGWMKRYSIVVALARNPKTPVAISMNLLARLSEKDLRAISSDRNVPEVLRITARQKIVLNK